MPTSMPVLPTLVVSKGKSVCAKLIPLPAEKRYDIILVNDASPSEMKDAEQGTYRKGDVVHMVDGAEHVNSIASIRGDFTTEIDGKRVKKNRLRLWEKSDVVFRDDDIFNERLFAIQWMKELPDGQSGRAATEFRSVTQADLDREEKVTRYVTQHLAEWQQQGFVPDRKIESGYNTDQPIRERGCCTDCWCRKNGTDKLKLNAHMSGQPATRQVKNHPIRKNGHQAQRKREAYCSDRAWEWTST